MNKTKFGVAAALAAALAVPCAGTGAAVAKPLPITSPVAPLTSLPADRLNAAVGAIAPTAHVVKTGGWGWGWGWPWYRSGCCGGYGGWGGYGYGPWGYGGYGGWGGYGGYGGWGGYGCCGGCGWGGGCGAYYPGYYGDFYGPYSESPYYDF